MPTTEAFLSYNAEDREFARSLCDALRELGVSVWIDEEHHEPVETWREKELKAIENSHFFLTLLGPHGIGDEQILEINFAVELHKQDKIGLIPILILGYDETKWITYERFVQSNFNRQDLRAGLDASKIHALASHIKHDILTPTPMPAQEEAKAPDNVRKKSTPRQVLVLSGGSGARTGTLSQKLAERLINTLGPNSCRVLPMERYYTGSFQTRSETHTNRYGDANFDVPDIIDFDQMVSDVKKLRAGSPIQIPQYDKQAHATTDFELIRPPSHFIILEGTYLLQNAQIRAISKAKIYVEVAPEIRFANRVWKDVAMFKMDLAEVLNYYLRAVKPAFDAWVSPYKDRAKKVELTTSYTQFDFARNQVPLNYSAATDKIIAFLMRKQLL